MKENDRAISTLHNLLDYDALKFNNGEGQLRNILPAWIDLANSLKLKDVLIKYLDSVRKHIEGIENFMDNEALLDVGISSRIMKAHIDEAEDKLSYCTDPEVRDACLLASVQGINHFKISIYGTAATFANAIGMEKEAAIFHDAEISEKQVDDRLSQLAKFEINTKAKAPISLQAN